MFSSYNDNIIAPPATHTHTHTNLRPFPQDLEWVKCQMHSFCFQISLLFLLRHSPSLLSPGNGKRRSFQLSAFSPLTLFLYYYSQYPEFCSLTSVTVTNRMISSWIVPCYMAFSHSSRDFQTVCRAQVSTRNQMLASICPTCPTFDHPFLSPT